MGHSACWLTALAGLGSTPGHSDKGKKETYSSLQTGLPSPLRELAYRMGSHSVTCHPSEVTFPPLPQPKLVLDLATPEGCKADGNGIK